jgi:cytoskeleton protein RodZ
LVQDTGTGIGRALRSARLLLGKSLEDASRETRVRSDYLEALEREEFERLRGDVYVRSFLRSYARYLGLSPEKVVAAYERLYGRPRPAPAPVEQAPGVAPTEAVILTGGQRRPSWLLAAAAAGIVLAAAAAIGLFSAPEAPPPATNAQPPPAVEDAEEVVRVELVARADLEVEARIDGDSRIVERMEQGEALSYEGQDRIEIRLSNGGAVEMEVNGYLVGTGTTRTPFEDTFYPSDFREVRSPSQPTPSP